MGNNNTGKQAQTPQAPPPDPMEQMLNMRMTYKRFERESNKALKEKDKQTAKARLCIKKNDEQGAKLFLQNATMKQNEAINLQRMSAKLQAIESTMKTAQNQQVMAQQMTNLTPYLNQHVEQMPVDQIYGQLQHFEQAMDEITVQGKIISSAVNQNTDFGQEMQIEQTLQQMKQDEALNVQDIGTDQQPMQQLNNQPQYQQPQQNYQQQQQQHQ